MTSTKTRRLHTLLLLFLVLAFVGHSAVSAASDAEAVRESISTTPWYDASSDSIIPVQLQPRLDDSVHRESRWLPKPKKLREKRTPNSNTQVSTVGNGLFGSSLTMGHLLAWCLLIAFIIGVVGIIIYGISHAEIRMSGNAAAKNESANSKKLPDSATLERIKHLPPELRRTDVNLRSECERLMNEEQFDQAIILLLGHQLLLLDRHGLLRLG
ncbi:MAG: hypothetical protein AAGJ83_03925, partial [Planctomycetota bacterium]